MRLAIVLATGDESAAWYVRSLSRAAARLSIECDVTDLGDTAAASAISAVLTSLSADTGVHGAIAQLRQDLDYLSRVVEGD